MPDKIPNLDTLIIDTVGSLVIVADREGRIVRFNAAGTRILGYQPHEIEGKSLCDFFPLPEIRQRCRERFARSISGEPFEYTTVWLTKSGEPRHISFVCRGAPGPSGAIEYSVGTGIDITDQVVAEQALRDSELRFRTTFQNATIGMALINQDGRYIDVNPAFCAMLGYGRDELLKLDWVSITHPDDREKNRELLKNAFEGKLQAFVFEKRYIKRSGEIVWVKISSSLAKEDKGRPATMIGLFENVTQQKKSEEAIREAYDQMRRVNETLEQHVKDRTAELTARGEELARSEQSFRYQSEVLQSIVNSMGDGVYVADAAGSLVLVNPAGQRMSGPVAAGCETVDERARRPWFFRSDGVTPLPPRELPLYRSTLGELVDDEEVFIHREGIPDLWVSATARPLYDEAGNLSGGVLVTRDVTERKNNESQIKQANLSLEQANASLRESERHYKELAESQLLMAREVEHRVRNNLAGLLSLISIMRTRTTDVRSFADAMESRITAMVHVHGLLAQRQWTPISLRELVDGTLATLQHMAPHSASTQVSGPDVLICPRHVLPMTLVLVEWFMNSCKYGPHSIPNGRLEISWTVTEPHLQKLHFTWKERGGPRVHEPATSSLGTDLVHGFVRRELAGRCELKYPPEGAEHLVEFATEVEG